MSKTIIGIDPGDSGAISFVSTKTNKLYVRKCHELISGRRISLLNAVEAFNTDENIAYIEKVHAMPHDGRSSLFKFGVNYGAWLGILHSNRKINKIIEVTPQKWMKFWQEKIGVKFSKNKTERKREIKEIAANYLSPNIKPTLWNADSILITMYGMYTEGESNDNRE